MKIRLSQDLKYELRRFSSKWGRHILQVGTGWVLGLLAVCFLATPLGTRLELFLLHGFYQLRGPRQPPSDVVVVAVDDPTYKELGASTNFPLPRKFIAQALETINKADPRVLILDGNIQRERLIDPDADDRIAAALRAGPSTIWNGEIPISADQNPEAVSIPSDDLFRRSAKMELTMAVFGMHQEVLHISSSSSVNSSLFERVEIAKALVELGHFQVGSPGVADLINYYGGRTTLFFASPSSPSSKATSPPPKRSSETK